MSDDGREWADDGRCCSGWRCNDCPSFAAPVAQEPPAPGHVLCDECGHRTDRHNLGDHRICSEQIFRDTTTGWTTCGCRAGVQEPLAGFNVIADPSMPPDVAEVRGKSTVRIKLGAQEPADPPWPQWLTDAVQAGNGIVSKHGSDPWLSELVIRAALPILRAGIEAELREKLAAQIRALQLTSPYRREDQWGRGFNGGIFESMTIVRGGS